MKSAARVRGPSALPSGGQVKGSTSAVTTSERFSVFLPDFTAFLPIDVPRRGQPWNAMGTGAASLGEASRRSRSSTPSIDASRSPPDTATPSGAPMSTRIPAAGPAESERHAPVAAIEQM
jgi:hypothetical protein